MTLTVSIIGLGYIGLPTAAVLADAGCKVVGVDTNPEVVNTINAGRIHIVEPNLASVVGKSVAKGALRATLSPEPADAFMIAVPTPFMNDRTPDLRFVRSACDSIAPVLKKGDIVILESTSPVGTTEQMAEWLAASRPDLSFARPDGTAPDVALAYCPERVLPGNVLVELVRNDRIIGGMTPDCAEKARVVYACFVKGECIVTDARTAEMCKLTENAFRDVNIAFANELSLICDRLRIDVWALIALANRHPRVNILQPGPGVGGHCIAVDPWFIVNSSPEEARVIRTAREVNDAKPEWVINKVERAVSLIQASGELSRPVRIACLGLAFKPNIDDLRESPSLEICRRLAEMPDCQVIAVEPHIDEVPPALDGMVEFTDAVTAVRAAEIILLLVDHDQFRDLWAEVPDHAHVIDTRGLWSGPRHALDKPLLEHR